MPEAQADTRAGIGAILLAAGESTRMDRPKQLLEWEGKPLVQYQVQELQATSAQEIVVVLGHEAGKLFPLAEEVMESARTRAVINPDYRQGKTTSIKTGLSNLRTAVGGVMLLAVDQPRTRDILQRLIDAHLTDDALVSVPSCGGKHGHPPLFHASLLRELMAITEERQGIREVIERHRDGLRAVAFDSPLVLTNINTPDDYRRARELADA